MFAGKPTRVITALVVCVQIMSSLFLAITVPMPQSIARASQVHNVFDVRDLPQPNVEAAPVAEPASPANAQTGDRQREDVDAAAVPAEEANRDEVQGEAPADSPAYDTSSNDDASLASNLPGAQAENAAGTFATSTLATDFASNGPYRSDELREQGVIFDGGYCYTWYSQKVLPGGGLAIEGRHVSDEGYVVDAQERIVVASSELPYGTELEVPFGSGRAVVADSGCAPGVIDVYTDF